MSHVWNVTMLIYLRSIVQNKLFSLLHTTLAHAYATLLLSFPENQLYAHSLTPIFLSPFLWLCRWLVSCNAHRRNSCEILQNRPVNFNYNQMTSAYFPVPAHGRDFSQDCGTHACMQRAIDSEICLICDTKRLHLHGVWYSWFMNENIGEKNCLSKTKSRDKQKKKGKCAFKIYNPFACAI